MALALKARSVSEGVCETPKTGDFLAHAFRSCARCIFSPNGAMLNQPRATPWVGVCYRMRSPERAKLRLRETLFRPFRAGDVVLFPDPGRRSRWSLALGWNDAAPLGLMTQMCNF